MGHKKLKLQITIYAVIFIIVAVIFETAILSVSNERQVSRTAQILLGQIENILDDNSRREEDILEALKAEYIGRANTVAYILSNNEDAVYDIDELKKIASLMDIDEIHLFDESGMIYAGTEPKYYELTFDSGEQVTFFKPMLTDKNLTMCQDVTPNTAESKSMMYAIAWNEAGTYMVQVGIEPVRLFKEFEQNQMQEVVKRMTAYEGMKLYVADIETGIIVGSSDEDCIGLTAEQAGILSDKDDINSIEEKSFAMDGYRNFAHYRQVNGYLVAIVHSTKVDVENFIISIGIEIAGLLLAVSVIIYILMKLFIANRKIKEQMYVLKSISDIYYSMHLIDMSDYSIEAMENNDLMAKVVQDGINAQDMLATIVDKTIEEEFCEAAREFVDLTTLAERLKNKNSIFMDAVDKNVGWLRISFIVSERDAAGLPTEVLVATQVVDEDKKREEELEYRANRDEMTGLFNRRAYEDDMLNFPDVPPEPDFVYAAIDINGLKVVNDTLGHMAGDELIDGAAECLKKTIGNYGRIYRTGGDEFVAMFFADEEHLEAVLADLEATTVEWRGILVDDLSVSVGCATKHEFATESVMEMAKIADQRMYKAKELHYSKKGVDRRGQAAAHTALCNLYTKILKINLTEDTYSIVNMDLSEQTKEKGFSDKISDWFQNFGISGQVHPDDLDEYLKKTNIEYLKDYFGQDKTSISIEYRRMTDDGFKEAAMEMIPANDYSNDNQSLFLYVKVVDR